MVVPSSVQLSTTGFAGWARANRIRLPYPLDVSDVPGPPRRQPAPDDPVLELVAAICAAPRLAVYAVRADPSGASDCVVAVAGGSQAVRISLGEDTTRIRETPDSELVTSVVGLLPDLVPARFDPVELSESQWSAALSAVGTAPEARSADLRAELQALGTGDRLAELLASASPASIAIGSLGAVVWHEAGAPLGDLGPGMASWHEYPGAAVLAHLRAPRHGGGNVVRVSGFTPDDAVRALGEAVAIALYRPRE